MNKKILSVTKKEFLSFFSAPIAYIFLGTFVLATYYIFFWVDKFFARNIADVRPLFNWMPILLIFLVSTITMRMWSEERKSGTFEFLMTAPIKTYELVIGKFLACLSLVSIALVLTASLPITVSFLGELDWGAVIGAYVASLFLAASYISIGLYLSSKSDNQIVSLILTIVIGSIFYLLGSSLFTGLFDNNFSELFKLLGSGSRFESISRGIIDFRDIYYYITLVGVFLSLNVYSLEKLKWSNASKPNHSKIRFFVIFLCLNFIVANLWLSQVRSLRVDITKSQSLTLSSATKDILSQLDEPLLIRGYFSKKTHPLLAPLVPQVKDILTEYEYASNGNLTVEVLDPKDNEELEEEAGRRYSIRPTPLQVSDKYQASLVNSYFDIVVQYGDKFEVLNFRDIIEVGVQNEGAPDVRIRNLEYDITRAVKKVLYGFQNIDSIFSSLSNPVSIKLYVSEDDVLPEQLVVYKKELTTALNEYKDISNKKFSYEVIDPKNPQVSAEIEEKYGFRPMVAGLFNTNPFYFYLVLEGGDFPVQVSLPQDMTIDGAKKSIESALKRVAPGFLKTIGVVKPKEVPMNPYLRQAPNSKQFNVLVQKLSQDRTVKDINLSDSDISEEIDLLLVLSPDSLEKKEQYKIDQFLMKGGTVVISSAPYKIKKDNTGISLEENKSGLEDWLLHYGVEFADRMIYDEQNEAFPIPVQRNLGGFMVEEVQMVNYPPFVDVREDGLNKDSGILSGISQVTLNWPSPILIDSETNKNREIDNLLYSSEESWTHQPPEVNPNYDKYPDYGFAGSDVRAKQLIGVLLKGKFDSYFSGKDLSFLSEEEVENPEEKDNDKEIRQEKISSVITKSPTSSKIVLYASNEFLADQTLQMSAVSGSSRYLNSLQLIENTIDWSLEDPTLLTIRGKGQYSKTLFPISDDQKSFWEYANYLVAFLMLLGVWLIFKIYKKSHTKFQLNIYGAKNV